MSSTCDATFSQMSTAEVSLDYTNIYLLLFSLFVMLLVTWMFKTFSKKTSHDYYQTTMRKRMVKMVSNLHEFHTVWPKLQEHIRRYRVIGLNAKWEKSHHASGPIALIQIGFPNGVCYLLHVRHFFGKHYPTCDKTLPIELFRLFSDSTLLKFGIGIIGVARKLRQDFNMPVEGCVDIRNLAVRLRSVGLSQLTTSDISMEWLCCTPEVDHSVIMHLSWETPNLSTEQLHYASFEVMISILAVVEFLCRKKKSVAYEVFNFVHEIRNYCQGALDKPFSRKPFGWNKSGQGDPVVRTTQHPDGIAVSDLNNRHNAYIVSLENEVLGTITPDLAAWYVNNDLAIYKSRDPILIQLSYRPINLPLCGGLKTPNGQSVENNSANRCVVCGLEETFIVKNIVPFVYRRCYPSNMKTSKASHKDLVRMCTVCYQICKIAQDEVKETLAKEFKAPFNSMDETLYVIHKQLVKVKTLSRQLINSLAPGFNNPLKQRVLQRALIEVFSDYLERHIPATLLPLTETTKLPRSLLLALGNLEVDYVSSHGTLSHGEKVVLWVLSHDSIADFEAMWRQHFIDSLTPGHLPPGWDKLPKHDLYAEMNFCAFSDSGLN